MSVRKTFEGRLSFPLDMLRYDCCWPATSDDVSAIQESFDFRPPGETLWVTVEKTKSRDDRESFALARWASFGWTPVDNIDL